MPSHNELRNFMFRRLLFEAETSEFKLAGIQVGSEMAEAQEAALVAEVLAPFGIELRTNALQNARLYALLFAFENSVRQLIAERLLESIGEDWWNEAVPQKVRELAISRRQQAVQNSWLEGDKQRLETFLEFGDLAAIIVGNWDRFSDLVPTQHWLQQRFDEIEQARNFIAHNRVLQPGEFQRLFMYIGDWDRQVGF